MQVLKFNQKVFVRAQKFRRNLKCANLFWAGISATHTRRVNDCSKLTDGRWFMTKWQRQTLSSIDFVIFEKNCKISPAVVFVLFLSGGFIKSVRFDVILGNRRNLLSYQSQVVVEASKQFIQLKLSSSRCFKQSRSLGLPSYSFLTRCVNINFKRQFLPMVFTSAPSESTDQAVPHLLKVRLPHLSQLLCTF